MNYSTERIFPLAQTFFISKEAYPLGLFATSVDLYMKAKPATNIPLRIELAATENGVPNALNVIPFSRVYIPTDQIKIPANPTNINSIKSSSTKVQFQAPVYLEPGKEYALIMLSNSSEYETFVAVMGQTILGTETIVRSQISLGTLFKSQNASVWTPFQNEDLMWKLNKAVFPVNDPGKIVFRNTQQTEKLKVNQFNHNLDPINFSGATSVVSEYQIKRVSNNALTPKVPYYLKSDIILPEEGYIENPDDLLVEMNLNTFHKDVTPFIDTTRNSLISVHNIVNNLGIQRSGISIIDAGMDYTQANTTITVTGGGGSSAVIQPVITNGAITDVIIVNPGIGYTSTPTLTISSPTGTGGNLIYTGGFETDPSDGNADGKYITRTIELQEGFEANYLTVQMDVNQPDGTEVQVYYRAKAAEDAENISAKNWMLMKKSTDSLLISPDNETFTEVTYIPTTPTIEYTVDQTTFTTASVVAVKVVFLSSNSTRVPKIKNLRAITTL